MSPDPWVGLEHCSYAHCLILLTPVEPKKSRNGMTLTVKNGCGRKERENDQIAPGKWGFLASMSSFLRDTSKDTSALISG